MAFLLTDQDNSPFSRPIRGARADDSDGKTAGTPMRISRNALGTSAMAGLAALASMAAVVAPARAVIISVSGVQWDVTKTLLPAGTSVSEFTSTYVTSQPWGASSNLSERQAIATAFAAALGGQLGYPNDLNQYGPFFAYLVETSPTLAYISATQPQSPGSPVFQTATSDPSDSLYYARATRVPGVVPGPLPILGGMAAFGWSRRLRRRVSLLTRP